MTSYNQKPVSIHTLTPVLASLLISRKETNQTPIYIYGVAFHSIAFNPWCHLNVQGLNPRLLLVRLSVCRGHLTDWAAEAAVQKSVLDTLEQGHWCWNSFCQALWHTCPGEQRSIGTFREECHRAKAKGAVIYADPKAMCSKTWELIFLDYQASSCYQLLHPFKKTATQTS